MRVLDLTHTIAENMPVYPGTETPIFVGANTYEKDGFKETKLTMYTHTGTHMDPPAHLFAGRTTLDAFPASQFIGKALVIECSDLNEGKAITLERILQYGKDAENADFLLFHLGWDKRWGTDAYFGDYPCLDDAAMDYIIAGDYKGIGFDVIGLDPIADENLTRHKKLFHGLLKRRKKLFIGKLVCCRAFFKAIHDQRFGHLIERIHFDVHQLMNDDLFKVFLPLGIRNIQKNDCFSVGAVDLDVAGFRPRGVFHKFKADIPRGCDPQFPDIFFKKCGQGLFFYHGIPPERSICCIKA